LSGHLLGRGGVLFDDRCECFHSDYRGREAAKNWVEGIHAVGEIKVRNTFMGETHAVAEAELVRKDGISVPYSVIYDVAAGKITALRLYFTGPVQP